MINSTNKCILNCKDDNIFNSKYEFNGGCYIKCPHGYYTKDDGTNICKCMTNIACNDCPLSNSGNNLCSTCNTNREYYPKKEENENPNELKNCYNSDTIENNYVLISGQYERCYGFCETCEEVGSPSEHKCIDCLEGYSKLNNNNNCYQDCTHYYYFNEDEYVCLNENKCPSGYKLIESTNKCIKNCKDVNKYEYSNMCIQQCPEYWTDTNDDHICKLDCTKFNLYYNFEKTSCINSIPKGYYLENNDNKYIGKCHENCEECEIGPTENNNNCLKCKSTGTIYYDFGNCRENCIHGNYIDENSVKKCKCSNNIKCKACNENGKCFSCNNEEGYYQIEDNNNENNEIIKCEKDPEGYYLFEGLYKKCNEKCKSCISDNECIECNSGFEFKNDFENDKKCYEKCTYNYYYDYNNIICTNDNSCPNGLKFIESKKRCIDSCKNDNKYKFEFDGKCFEQCPDDTHISSEDNNKCEEIIEETTIIEEEKGECNLNLNEYELSNETLTVNELNNFTKNYASKYGKSDNYITKIENEFYKIFIYNNIICLENVSPDAKLIDFGDNYLNLLGEYQIQDPITMIVTDKKSNVSTYSFSDPNTGEILDDLNQAFRNLNILVREDINNLLSHLDNKRREYILYMLKQEIDLFNPSNEFYSDLCFHYDSPNNRDIPMRDRASFFYTNINKCEPGCIFQGIDYANAKFK